MSSSEASRVSVYVAAEVLGVTVDAIRKRIQRGTIPHERDEDGRVWVLLDPSSKVQDEGQDTYRPPSDASALISQMREEIAYLREESRRKDHIIAGLVERIPPAIEARESPVSSAEGSEGTESRSAAGGEYAVTEEPHAQQEEPQGEARRSWWGRIFGY